MEDPPRTPPDEPVLDFGWGERRREPPAEDDLYAGAGPNGWTDRGTPPPPPAAHGLDFSAVFVLLDAARRAAPAELQERVTALIREALLTLRSLIDWYLERLDRRPRETRVEDIPID